MDVRTLESPIDVEQVVETRDNHDIAGFYVFDRRETGLNIFEMNLVNRGNGWEPESPGIHGRFKTEEEAWEWAQAHFHHDDADTDDA